MSAGAAVCKTPPFAGAALTPQQQRSTSVARQTAACNAKSKAVQPCRLVAIAGHRSATANQRLHAQASQAAAALDSELTSMLEQLMEKHSELEEEELAKRVTAIEQRSAELGYNKVTPELNDGSFTAQPLAGRLKKVTGPAAKPTLGGLTFAAVKPLDLECAFRPIAEPPIFKGEREGVPNAYTVTSGFSIPSHDLAGVNTAVGTYTVDEQNPQRLIVTFTEVIVTPEFGEGDSAEALARWVGLFEAANPEGSVDRTTGAVRVQLAAPASAQLDYLVMAPGWQMTRSNFGSIALLKTA